MKKPRKVGRPKMEKGHAKAKMVTLRLKGEDLKRIAALAKADKQSVSEWIRSTLNATIQG